MCAAPPVVLSPVRRQGANRRFPVSDPWHQRAKLFRQEKFSRATGNKKEANVKAAGLFSAAPTS